LRCERLALPRCRADALAFLWLQPPLQGDDLLCAPVFGKALEPRPLAHYPLLSRLLTFSLRQLTKRRRHTRVHATQDVSLASMLPPLQFVFYTGISGARERRPELDRMLAACRRRLIDAVVVYRYDRFARSLRQLVNALCEFDALGIQFVSLHEGIDTSTPNGRLVFGIFASIAEFERELIRERVRSGIAVARAQGKRIGRPRRPVDAGRVRELRALGWSWLRSRGSSVPGSAQCTEQVNKRYHDITSTIKGKAGICAFSKGIYQLKMVEGSNTFFRSNQSKAQLFHDVNGNYVADIDAGNDSCQMQMGEAEPDEGTAGFSRQSSAPVLSSEIES